MPLPFVKKVAKRKGMSTKQAEKKWEEADKIAKESAKDPDNRYGLTTHIFKRKMHMKEDMNEAMEFFKGHYPSAYMRLNHMGHLEIWKGPKDHGQSDLYLQHDEDVKQVLKDLPSEQRDYLKKGWDIVTKNFNNEHFLQEGTMKKKVPSQISALLQRLGQTPDASTSWPYVPKTSQRDTRYTLEKDINDEDENENNTSNRKEYKETNQMEKEILEFRNFIKNEIPMDENHEELVENLRVSIEEAITSSGSGLAALGRDVVPARAGDGTEEDLPPDIDEVDIDDVDDTTDAERTGKTGTKGIMKEEGPTEQMARQAAYSKAHPAESAYQKSAMKAPTMAQRIERVKTSLSRQKAPARPTSPVRNANVSQLSSEGFKKYFGIGKNSARMGEEFILEDDDEDAQGNEVEGLNKEEVMPDEIDGSNPPAIGSEDEDGDSNRVAYQVDEAVARKVKVPVTAPMHGSHLRKDYEEFEKRHNDKRMGKESEEDKTQRWLDHYATGYLGFLTPDEIRDRADAEDAGPY